MFSSDYIAAQVPGASSYVGGVQPEAGTLPSYQLHGSVAYYGAQDAALAAYREGGLSPPQDAELLGLPPEEAGYYAWGASPEGGFEELSDDEQPRSIAMPRPPPAIGGLPGVPAPKQMVAAGRGGSGGLEGVPPPPQKRGGGLEGVPPPRR
jgi:hypothetical protein